MDEPAVRISVVVPTTSGLQAIEARVARIARQLEAELDELLVMDARPLDAAARPPAVVRHVHMPGASVFDLRARGIVAARGSIVLLTEDHVDVAQDWVERHIEAHERHPDHDAIGGAIDNASTRTIGDWTNFLVTFGGFAPPISRHPQRGLTISNSSYKRRALSGAVDSAGWLEFTLHAALMQAERTEYDDEALVAHDQPRTVWATMQAHFHNGRSTTGLARGEWDASERRRRRRACSSLPRILYRNATQLVADKPRYGTQARRCAPFIALVCVAHAVGEYVGIVLGAGSSPSKLE